MGQVNLNTGPSSNMIGSIQSAEVPIDMFTGTATVSVPIYTIQNRGASLPISLSYNTGGIKVKQLGTSIGLGWNLNVGGSISREVKGSPDEYMTLFYERWKCNGGITQNEEDAYYQESKFPESICIDIDNSSPPSGPRTIKRMIKGKLYPLSEANLFNEYKTYDSQLRDDNEADIFYLNVGSYNCKFILKTSGDVEMLNNVDVKIKYYHDYVNTQYERKNGLESFVRHGQYKSPYEISRFVVTDPNGYVYHFEAVERVLSGKRKAADYIRRNHIFGPNVEMDDIHMNWKLTKIVNPYGESLINLFYSKEYIQTEDQKSASIQNDPQDYLITNSVIIQQAISHIEFGNGSRVSFEYGDFREDIYYSDSYDKWGFGVYNSYMLDAIKIYPTSDPKYYQKYKLTYERKESVFNQISNIRYFLNKVNLEAKRGDNIPLVLLDLYSFIYDDTELAHPYKYNEDFWGYNRNPSTVVSDISSNIFPRIYNYEEGITNNSVNKKIKRSSSIFRREVANNTTEEIIGSCIRDCEPDYVKAGTLKKIVNAAGKITEIEYESHDFLDPNIMIQDQTDNVICLSNTNPLNCTYQSSKSYTVAAGHSAEVNFENNYVDAIYTKSGNFCFGWVSPLPDCENYLEITGSNFQIDVGINYSANHFASQKFRLYTDYYSWETSATLKVFCNNVFYRDIVKGDLMNLDFFEFDLPLGTQQIKIVAGTGMSNNFAACDYYITSVMKRHYELQYFKNNVFVSSFNLNDFNGSITLTQGDHKFQLVSIPDLYQSAIPQRTAITLFKYDAPSEDVPTILGGGLRIKSITANDGVNTVKKSYYYKDVDRKSSGRLLFMPEFYNKISSSNLGYFETSASAYPINPRIFENPSNVGYKRIEEIIEGKGWSVSDYDLVDFPMITGTLPQVKNLTTAIYLSPIIGAEVFSPIQNINSQKGLLIKKETFNQAGKLVMTQTMQYKRDVYKKIPNYRIARLNQSAYMASLYGQQNPKIRIDYTLFGFDDRPVSSSTTSYKYDANGAQSSSTSSTTYEYRTGAIALPKATTTVSGGIVTKVENTVVADLPGTYTDFISKNMLYMPVESKTFRNNIQIGGEKIEYATFGTRTLPKKIQTWMYDRYIYTKEYLAYTSKGEPTTIMDLLRNKTTTNVYETDFEAIRSTTYDGRSVNYTYYPDRLLNTKTTSADGVVLTYEYDALGILKKTTDNLTNMIAEHEYSLGGGSTTSTDKLQLRGHTHPAKVSKYTAGGTLTETTQGDGLAKVKTDFAKSSVESESTFSTGKTMDIYEQSLNPSWKKTTISTWPGEWTEWTTHEGGGTKVKAIDPDGRYSESVVDGLGRTVSKGRGGFNAGYTYDDYGRLTQITQPGGGLFTNVYSWDGSVLTTTSTIPGGGTTVSKTNLKGQLTEMTDEMGRVFTYFYDARDRLHIEKLNGQPLKTYTYYESGINVDKVSTIEHRTIGSTIYPVIESYSYDGMGRLINNGASCALGSMGSTYYYDGDDFLNMKIEGGNVNINGGIGSTATWRYSTNDIMHRVENEVLELGSHKELVARYGYNGQKKVSTKTLGGNLQTVDYEYNGADWLSAINHVNDCVYGAEPPPKDGGVTTNTGIVIVIGPGNGPKNINIKTTITQTGTSGGNTVYNYNNSVNTNVSIKQNNVRYPGTIGVNWTGLGNTNVLLGSVITRIHDSLLVVGGGGMNSSDSLNLRWVIKNELDKSKVPCIFRTDDAFAEEIYYNNSISSGNVPMKGGLICGTKWQVGVRKTIPEYAYSYDGKGWLMGANYRERNTSAAPNTPNGYIRPGAYNESVGYTGAGDINSVSRSGYHSTSVLNGNTYGGVDNINMTYTNGRLTTTTEGSSGTLGWQHTGTSGNITYDAAGNMLKYPAKGIVMEDIEYNHLNLPQKIVVKGKGTYTAIYDAMGRLWQYKIEPATGPVLTRYYRNGFEILKIGNDAPQIIAYNHAHGRHISKNGGWGGEYVIHDHIGNPRVFVKDEDGNGRIDLETEIFHEKHFYPYGMPMEGNYNNNNTTGWFNKNTDPEKECHFGHNNMDYVTALELDMYFTTFRSMDPGIGRWLQVDPKAEADPAMSVYASMGNNPVSNVDPDGDIAHVIATGIGMVIGGAMYAIKAEGDFSMNGLGRSIIDGGASGLTSWGIGSLGAGLIGGAVLHGINQGLLSDVQGGDFWQGFATGSVSSVVAGGISGINTGNQIGNVAVTIAGGGVAGGFTSALTGGSFWDGMKTGLIVAGLNHAMHMGIEAIAGHGPKDPPSKAQLKEYAAGEFMKGNITRDEYILAVYYIDGEYMSMAQQLLSSHGTEAALTFIPVGRLAKAGGWVQKSIWKTLDPAIQKKVLTAINKGIVAPTGQQGIIKLTATEAAATGYTHKIKILGKGGDIRIYGNQLDNGHFYFQKLMTH